MVCTDTGRSVWESLSENLRRRLGCEVGMGELGVPVAARDLKTSAFQCLGNVGQRPPISGGHRMLHRLETRARKEGHEQYAAVLDDRTQGNQRLGHLLRSHVDQRVPRQDARPALRRLRKVSDGAVVEGH